MWRLKAVNYWTTVAKLSILDVCGSPRYASDKQHSNFVNAVQINGLVSIW